MTRTCRISEVSPIFIILFSVVLLFTITSCVSVRLDNRAARQDINRLSKPDYPSFTGVGSINISGAGTDYSSSITLALSGEKYRMEIFNAVGKTVVAVAGEPSLMIRVDPATGQRREFIGASSNVVKLSGLGIPVSILRSMVSGAPPAFGKVVSAYVEDGVKRVTVSNPEMVIEYAGKIKRIIILGDDDEAIIVSLGPFAEGPRTPYVSSVMIEFPERDVAVDIRWNRVTQGSQFAKGFFFFDEVMDDLLW